MPVVNLALTGADENAPGAGAPEALSTRGQRKLRVPAATGGNGRKGDFVHP